MPGSGHRSATNRALVARLDQRDIGRLRVGRGGSALRVSVLDGEIVGASSRDDLRHLLRRLLLAGAISTNESEELIKLDKKAGAAFGKLLDLVDDEIIQGLLHERFVENLSRFLGSSATPRFTHLPTIFADNLQIGHDADELLQTCADNWDDALSLDLNTMLFSGPNPPRDPLQKLVHQRIGQGLLVSRLLIQLPAEPFTARALIARMLRARVLDTDIATEPDTGTDGGEAPRFTDEGSEASLGEPIDDEWRPEGDTPVSVGPLLDQEPPAAEPDDLAAEPETDPNIDPATDPGLEDLGDALEPDAREETGSGDPDATDPAPLSDDLDDPTTAETPLPDTSGAGNLRSLDDWLNHGVEVDDDLEAFSDHDNTRGGADGEEGAFTTEDHNLDRVEVATLEPETIAVDEAPVAKFSAPVLSEADAVDRIQAANNYVLAISAAMDEAKGRGRGQSAMQILLDGSPNDVKALFNTLQATDDGGLPVDDVLQNLQIRPEAEHRRLLTKGLTNLVERYLSICFEDLSDEAIDEVLEKIAGYSQRLGL